MSINGPLKQVKRYTDGLTKQSFKDETDIQKIMARADKAGTISHLEKFQGVYADYSEVDFQELTQQLAQGRSIFDELPAEIRKEFGQSPDRFYAYVNDPANAGVLDEKLPALAAPGRQVNNPTVAPSADELAAPAAASEPLASKPIPSPAVATSTPGPAPEASKA